MYNSEYGIVKDMFEGDIKLTPKQKELMSESKHQIHERAVVRDRDERWPGAVIPYVMDSSLGERNSKLSYPCSGNSDQR